LQALKAAETAGQGDGTRRFKVVFFNINYQNIWGFPQMGDTNPNSWMVYNGKPYSNG
jgi:hypothetical protein